MCWTMTEAMKEFTSRGYVLSGPFEHEYAAHSDICSYLYLIIVSCRKGFQKDEHIPNLLLFPPDSQWVEDDLYKSGKIILQDKASCFPALVLSPPASDNAVVLDATAAPGNKTSHLSALMKGKGKVSFCFLLKMTMLIPCGSKLYAFERDRKRFSTLQMMLKKARCKNVQPINADFLTTSPDDSKFTAVTHMSVLILAFACR